MYVQNKALPGGKGAAAAGGFAPAMAFAASFQTALGFVAKGNDFSLAGIQ